MLWMQTSNPEEEKFSRREEGCITRRLFGGTLLPLRQKKDELSHDIGAFYRIMILGNGEVATSPVLKHDSGVEYKRY